MHFCTKMMYMCVVAYGTTLTLIHGVVPAAVHTCLHLRIPSLYRDAIVRFVAFERIRPQKAHASGFHPNFEPQGLRPRGTRAGGSLCSLPGGNQPVKRAESRLLAIFFLRVSAFIVPGFRGAKCPEWHSLSDRG